MKPGDLIKILKPRPHIKLLNEIGLIVEMIKASKGHIYKVFAEGDSYFYLAHEIELIHAAKEKT